MAKLEDLQPNTSVKGILPDRLVAVVSVQWFGSEALELTYKDGTGRVANQLLYRHDEPRLEIAEAGFFKEFGLLTTARKLDQATNSFRRLAY